VAVVKLVLEYDGTNYHGWQRQPNRPTVQGALEAALFQFTRQPIAVFGAGRTDAGVHARGQVAHLVAEQSVDSTAWMRSLNALLPRDIAVCHVEEVAPTFHARYSAREKVYEYRIHHAPHRSPLHRQRAWHVWYPLNLRAVRAAAGAMIGVHDFHAFCASDYEGDNHQVDLREIGLTKRGDQIRITFRADRFLKYMVRNLTGFLLEVGRGRRSPDEVAPIIASRDRRQAGPTAPPQGLTLMRVIY
jgi:tRNA pseudouridine38-40 synthase